METAVFEYHVVDVLEYIFSSQKSRSHCDSLLSSDRHRTKNKMKFKTIYLLNINKYVVDGTLLKKKQIPVFD